MQIIQHSIQLKMTRKKSQAQQYCVNCHQPFVNNLNDDEWKEEFVQEITIDYKFPITSWSVESCLSSLYNLHHLNKLPVFLLGEEDGKKKSKTKKVAVCTKCAAVLTNLYRNFVEFNRLSNVSSYLSKKVQQLDEIMTMFQSTWTEMSQLYDDQIQKEESGDDDSLSSNSFFPMECANSPLSPVEQQDETTTPKSSNFEDVPNINREEQMMKNQTRVNKVKSVKQNSKSNSLTSIDSNNGPWVKIHRLSPEEILKAITRAPLIKVQNPADDPSVESPISQVRDVPNYIHYNHSDNDEIKEEFSTPVDDDNGDSDFIPDDDIDGDIGAETSGEENAIVPDDEENFAQCKKCHRQFRLQRSLKAHTKICHGPGGNPNYRMKRARPKRRSKAEIIEWIKRKKEMDATKIKRGKYYNCPLCQNENNFANIRRLCQHWTIDHQYKDCNDNPSCPICKNNGNEFTTESSTQFQDHLKTHAMELHLICPTCHKVFKRTKDLKLHVKNASCTQNFKCSHCSKMFRQKGHLAGHMKMHMEKKLSCTNCHRNFALQFDLDKHMKTCPVTTVLYCPICQKSFNQKHTLNKHIRGHPTAEPLTCPEPNCQKVFNKIDPFRFHCMTHKPDSEKPYVCSTCGVRFPLSRMLKDHMRAHGARPYLCAVCGRGFTQRGVLRIHTLSHSTDLKYKCKNCPAAFKRPDVLRIHSMSHSPQNRRHLCQMCGASFLFPYMLTRHMKLHTQDTSYACQDCDKRFLSETSLRKHITRTHVQKRPFQCSLCDRSYTSKICLSLHTRFHTDPEGKPFKCQICKIGFSNARNRRKHFLTHSDAEIQQITKNNTNKLRIGRKKKSA